MLINSKIRTIYKCLKLCFLSLNDQNSSAKEKLYFLFVTHTNFNHNIFHTKYKEISESNNDIEIAIMMTHTLLNDLFTLQVKMLIKLSVQSNKVLGFKE